MLSITTLFHYCPSCGRRFEIRLVSEEPEVVHVDWKPPTGDQEMLKLLDKLES